MTKINTISYNHRVYAFWTLASLCVGLALLYFLAVNSTARNTALLQAFEREAVSLSAELGQLEFENIALKNEISMELAFELGFKEKKNPLYISRRSETPTLSYHSLSR